MIIFIKVILYTLYDLLRYRKNQLLKKNHNQTHFEKLNKINTKILNKKILRRKRY